MVECPVCLRDIKLSESAREGDVMQCPHCKVWFRLVKEDGQFVGERV